MAIVAVKPHIFDVAESTHLITVKKTQSLEPGKMALKLVSEFMV